MMWTSWSALGLFQIGTRRWFRNYFKLAFWGHVFGGTAVLILTLSSLATILQSYGWSSWNYDMHTAGGFLMITLSLFVIGFGMLADHMRYGKKEWVTTQVLTISNIHKYGALSILGLGQLVISGGIFTYSGGYSGSAWAIACASAGIFISVILGFEFDIKLQSGSTFKLKPHGPTFTTEEVRNKIKQGGMLVILDGQVLDITSFYKYHPGGRFVLTTRLGRDITGMFKGAAYSGQTVQGANS
jgi:hypothetical protein